MGPPTLDQTRFGRNVRATTASKTPLRSITLRWKGHTVQYLGTLREVAGQLAETEDYEMAEAKYRELLEAAKHLLPSASEESSGLAYEVAIFYARNDDMTKADEVLDELSAQFIQRWGSNHEKTVKHYSVVARLLTLWDRHDDAVNILKQMTDGFSTSILSSGAKGQPNRGQTPHSAASPSQVYLDNPLGLAQSSIHFVANTNEETSPSSTLAVLREQITLSRAIVVDNDESMDRLILDLLHRMEANPERNGTDILRARLLLVDFYEKADLPEASMSALQAAKHSVQSL